MYTKISTTVGPYFEIHFVIFKPLTYCNGNGTFCVAAVKCYAMEKMGIIELSDAVHIVVSMAMEKLSVLVLSVSVCRRNVNDLLA